jgi:hypothetical protein
MWSQAGTSNADLVKMIQAGLPENTVVNKIRQNAGKWDTSVDALIALKSAGATPAELDAVTAIPTATSTAAMNPMTPTTPDKDVMGGKLEVNGGDVTLFEPGYAKYQGSDQKFRLVVVNGQAALVMRTYAVHSGALAATTSTEYGDMLFEHDKVTFLPYGKIKWGAFGGNTANGHVDKPADALPEVVPVVYSLSSLQPKAGVYLEKKDKYQYLWMGFFEAKAMPMASQEFMIALLRDYDATLAKLLASAGITDPNKQLSAASHFVTPDARQVQTIIAKRNDDVAMHGGKRK